MAPGVQVGSHHSRGRGIPHAGQGVSGDGLTLCPVCPVCPCPDCYHSRGRGIPHAGQGVSGDGLTLCPVCPVCPVCPSPMPRLLQAHAQRCIKSHATLSQGICSCCRARGGVLMPWQQGSRPDWGSETGRHADMQVSMERTIGTVCGGLLGLGISLLGHGFGQDSDMVFTGDTLPALLHGVRATQ